MTQQSAAVTQHRAAAWLTSDMSLAFTVFEHPGRNEVSSEMWAQFQAGYKHAHGSEPDDSLAGYVAEGGWLWDTSYTDGAIVIGDPTGPLAVESGDGDDKGCRIVFWHEGSPYDTGLRIWAEEASILATALRDRAVRDGR